MDLYVLNSVFYQNFNSTLRFEDNFSSCVMSQVIKRLTLHMAECRAITLIFYNCFYLGYCLSLFFFNTCLKVI